MMSFVWYNYCTCVDAAEVWSGGSVWLGWMVIDPVEAVSDSSC